MVRLTCSTIVIVQHNNCFAEIGTFITELVPKIFLRSNLREQNTKKPPLYLTPEIAGKGALDLSSGEMTTPAKGHLPPPGVNSLSEF